MSNLETGFPFIYKTALARKEEEQTSLPISFPQFPPASHSPLKASLLWLIELAFDLTMPLLARLHMPCPEQWIELILNLSPKPLDPSLVTWLGLDADFEMKNHPPSS